MPLPLIGLAVGAVRTLAPKALGMVAKGGMVTGVLHAGKSMLGIGDDDKKDEKKQPDEQQNQQGSPQNQQQPGAGGYSGPGMMGGPQMMSAGYPQMPMAPGGTQVMSSPMMTGQMPVMNQMGQVPGQGQTSMVPMVAAGAAGVGLAGTGVAMTQGQQVHSVGAPGAEKSTPFGEDKDSKLMQMAKTGLAAAAGGAGAFMLKQKEGGDMGESIKAGLAGAGSGGFAKMAYDSVQSEGQGLRAGLQGAAAGALGSMVKDGGPSAMASALTGGGAGLLGNTAHDRLESKGMSTAADATAGGSLAASLGYAVTGDKSTSLLAGLGGAGASTLDGALDRGGSLGDLVKAANPFDDKNGADKTAAPEGPQAQPGMA